MAATEQSYIHSPANFMNIYPHTVHRPYTYHIGVYKRDEQGKLIEIDRIESAIKVEDYFPLIIHNLNKRGNWQYIPFSNIEHIPLSLSWTNTIYIDNKAQSHARLSTDTVKNIISDKYELYNLFKDQPFIIPFSHFTKHMVTHDIFTPYKGKGVIIKPDAGRSGHAILLQKSMDYDAILKHIQKFQYSDWTISEIVTSKLCKGYITTNRIYFLIVKRNAEYVDAYYYTEFVNYIPVAKFTGDVQDPLQMLTNKLPDTYDQAEYLKTRFVSHKKWLKMFSRSQQRTIISQIENIFNTVTHTIKDKLLATNDNKTGDRVAFHVYGADIIVDDRLNVKLLEFNTAPAMNAYSEYYRIKNRLNYFDLFDDLFDITIDTIYKPQQHRHHQEHSCMPISSRFKHHNKFKQIYSGPISHLQPNVFYIPNSIIQKYPFILNALYKRPFLKRSRNMYDKIDVFYGLRERYITPDTNLNYYDEILNYNKSKLMREASIINKIQGITYYLANKGNMYNKLIATFGYDMCDTFHPISLTLCYSNPDQVKHCITDFLHDRPTPDNHISGHMTVHVSNAIATLQVGTLSKSLTLDVGQNVVSADVHITAPNKYRSGSLNVGKWILKPAHGSMGMGILIVDADDKETMIDNIVKHMQFYNNQGITHTINKVKGFFSIPVQETVIKKYNYWILSQYLDRPHLLYDRKYNIRFYALVVINGALPTFKDITTTTTSTDIAQLYIFNDCMLYTAILPYYGTIIPPQYAHLDTLDIYNMRNLTNLEIINKIAPDNTELKAANTFIMSHTFPTDLCDRIKTQGQNIIKSTIESVKYDLRGLNRHSDNYKGCFNLLAYDTMLDEDLNLWLIEVNRGPDMCALQLKYGDTQCTEIFDDIFRATVDPHFVDIANTDKIQWFTKHDISYDVCHC